MALIEVENLVKEYKRKISGEGIKDALYHILHPVYETFRAVDDISFSIEKGESVGYIGPNGSGKSTTIKMLTGILTPTAGSIHINGRIPTKERIKNNREIGVVTGNRSTLYWDVPIIESFRLFQKLYEVPDNIFRKNLEEFTEIMGLESLLHVPERQLSLGQRMRCNIAAAFLHNPKTVYLDEPTIGLDSESKRRIRTFIKKMNDERDTTFIITSHDFQDIEMLCRRIILINHGKVVLDNDIEKVRKDFDQKKKVRFEVENNYAMKSGEHCLPGVSFQYIDSYLIEAEYNTEEVDAMTVVGFVSKYCPIKDITITGRDIETIVQDILYKRL